MERQSSSQTTGPANRTVSVMTRLESNTGARQNSTGKLIQPSKTKKPGCAPKLCRPHRNEHSPTDYPVRRTSDTRPSSATSLQQTNISVPPTRQLSFQEPRKLSQQRSIQQPVTKANLSTYANSDRYIPCPQQQQPVICICSTEQNNQFAVSPTQRRSSQEQQVIPPYPVVPPYATNNTDNKAGKNSMTFCSANNPSTYTHKFISPCRCGQYHEYQAELLLPRPYRQASAIFQHVPAPTPAKYQQNQPPMQICYSPGSQRSYANEPNYLIREQPTRDNDIEGSCACCMSPCAMRTPSGTKTSLRQNSSSFKVSPMGYAQMDDGGYMEAVEQPDTICLPCGHTFPEGPKDTCWRVKIMKDVGCMTKGLEFGIQTQTSETRIITSDKLEELLPPEERFIADDMDPFKQQTCLCLEIAQGISGSDQNCPGFADEICCKSGSCTNQGKRPSQLSSGSIQMRSPRTSNTSGAGQPAEDCCTACPEFEEHLKQARGKKACVIM